MVLISLVRQSAGKRIPLIKFRRQREQEAAVARSGSLGGGASKGPSASSPAAVCLCFRAKNAKNIKEICCSTSTMYDEHEQRVSFQFHLLTLCLSNSKVCHFAKFVLNFIRCRQLVYQQLKIGSCQTDIVENHWTWPKLSTSIAVDQLNVHIYWMSKHILYLTYRVKPTRIRKWNSKKKRHKKKGLKHLNRNKNIIK